MDPTPIPSPNYLILPFGQCVRYWTEKDFFIFMSGIGQKGPSSQAYPSTISARQFVDGSLRIPERGHMNNGAHVLVMSRDQSLLQTRQLILGAFFQVEAAGRVQEAAAIIASQNFDLIVLCHSLSADECSQVAAMAHHQVPPPKILTLSAAGNSCMNDDAEHTMALESGPYALLKKAAEMLGVDLKDKVKKKLEPVPISAPAGREEPVTANSART
jgi:hypothetical protein